MKKVLLSCIILITVITSSCSASAQYETRGFDTPTECAQAVFDALNKQDISAIEDCFAIPEMARLFDFQKYCERLSAVYTSYTYTYMPSTTELGIAYNEAYIRTRLYRLIALSSALLADRVYGAKINSGETYSPLDDDVYALIAFMESPSAMEGFGGLTLESIVTPDTIARVGELYNSELNTRNRVIQMSMWLVEDNVELMLVTDSSDNLLSDDKIVIPLRFVQIGGKWLADPTESNLRAMMGVPYNNLFILLSEI